VAGEKDSKESEQLSKGALELVQPFLEDPDRAYDLGEKGEKGVRNV
jgi:hypothetical protein